MKALVKKEPMKGIWMEEVAMPKVGVNDVLIKIKKTAICGTDLHIYKWDEWSQKTIKTPMTIGHEYVGVVAEVGPGVRNIQVGDRVTGEGHIACGHCRNCRRGLQHICENSIGVGVNRDGAFAEYLCIPESNVVKLDDRISDDMAAIMDPFGNATHTALSFPLLGEDVLITGAGLIGTMATAIAKFAGAKNIVVTDLSDYRLDIAKKMGATCTVNASKAKHSKALWSNSASVVSTLASKCLELPLLSARWLLRCTTVLRLPSSASSPRQPLLIGAKSSSRHSPSRVFTAVRCGKHGTRWSRCSYQVLTLLP